jgi:hypothetical protein
VQETNVMAGMSVVHLWALDGAQTTFGAIAP